jgi:hypothetical protein
LPAIGSDISDPAVKESSYDATPLAAAVSLFAEGLKPLSKTYGSIKVPLLLSNAKLICGPSGTKA